MVSAVRAAQAAGQSVCVCFGTHLEDEVDRCKEDRRDDSVPLKLPKELRRPGMNVDVTKQTRYARQGQDRKLSRVTARQD